MSESRDYNTHLAAGLGALAQTRILLELWEPGMTPTALYQSAHQSGRFARLSARRLKNLVLQCFARRYLVDDGAPAQWLKALAPHLTAREFDQIAFIYTCRANKILADFVLQVYWPEYTAGQERIHNQTARGFVVRVNQEHCTGAPWTEHTIRRVAGYLTGACADFGLLENGPRRDRKILPFRIESGTAAFLAHEQHFAELGDNAIVAAVDWKLFGLDSHEIVGELKRLALKGLFILQTVGDIICISWKYHTGEELADALSPR